MGGKLGQHSADDCFVYSRVLVFSLIAYFVGQDGTAGRKALEMVMWQPCRSGSPEIKCKCTPLQNTLYDCMIDASDSTAAQRKVVSRAA